MIKVSTFFQNRVTSANLIFRDKENKGVNLIYYPELGSSGIEFINKYRKKNYWDYVVIPQAIMFLSHKVYTNNYYKEFKKNIPMIRIQRKFIKVNNEIKSIVVDLSPLSQNFTAFSKSRSKKQTMDAFFRIVEQFGEDSKISDKDCFLVVDNTTGEEKEMVESLFYMSRLSSNKLRIKNIEGIMLYGGRKFWPLTIKESDKDGEYFKINVNIFARYMKEVHGEEAQETETPEEAVQNTKQVVRALYDVHQSKLKSSVAGISGAAKKTDTIEENPIELIKNEVQSNKHIAGKTFEEKLSNLFREPSNPKISKEAQKVNTRDKKSTEMVKNINQELKEINKRYNGTIELNESSVMRNRKSFYNPFKIIGFNDFSAYNKQDTEFGETLDQAIFDLIKSIEGDKDTPIKILNIKTDITDTNRDRYKTYKIKLQHKGFGHEKPYTVSFHVPTPSKGKYLKLGGNDWIMINQFFPKPVIKIGPELVRLYTHYGTLSVSIKTHALNPNQDVKELLQNFGNSLKRTKKLVRKPEVISEEKCKNIIDKYNLPDNINSDIFVNLEIK